MAVFYIKITDQAKTEQAYALSNRVALEFTAMDIAGHRVGVISDNLDSETVRVLGRLDNKDFTRPLRVNFIQIFAKVGDRDEFIFAEARSVEGDIIPIGSKQWRLTTYAFDTKITNDGEVRIVYNGADVYVTHEDLDNSRQFLDTRKVDEPPSYYLQNYPRTSVQEYKEIKALGVPVENEQAYGVLETVVPWTDEAGGLPSQEMKANSERFSRYALNNTKWSEWERLESVKLEQNLLQAGNREVRNNNLWLAWYNLAEGHDLTDGETVTLVAEVELARSVRRLCFYNTTGNSFIAGQDFDYNGYTGVISLTGKWRRATETNNNRLGIHVFSRDPREMSTIKWAKLVRGDDTSLTYYPPTIAERVDELTDIQQELEDRLKLASDTLIAIEVAIEERLTTIDGNITKIEGNVTSLEGEMKDRVTHEELAESRKLLDTREFNRLPSYYLQHHPHSSVKEFKRTSVIGVPNHLSYCTVETTTPWIDSTGGWPTQEATIANEKYIRVGISMNSWGGWTKL